MRLLKYGFYTLLGFESDEICLYHASTSGIGSGFEYGGVSSYLD